MRKQNVMRILALVITMVMMFSVASCNFGKKEENTTPQASETVTTPKDIEDLQIWLAFTLDKIRVYKQKVLSPSWKPGNSSSSSINLDDYSWEIVSLEKNDIIKNEFFQNIEKKLNLLDNNKPFKEAEEDFNDYLQIEKMKQYITILYNVATKVLYS